MALNQAAQQTTSQTTTNTFVSDVFEFILCGSCGVGKKHCGLYTPHFTVYTSNFKLYTWHSALYIERTPVSVIYVWAFGFVGCMLKAFMK